VPARSTTVQAIKHSGPAPMKRLSTQERNLLRYYAEGERVIHGRGRGAVHLHLLRMCYIEERPVNLQDSVVVVTAAGRMALSFRS